MRRDNRKTKQTDSLNIMLYVTGGMFLLAVLAFGITFAIYSNKYNEEELDSEYLAQFETTEQENTTSASTTIGKTIEESERESSHEENVNKVSVYNKEEHNSKDKLIEKSNKDKKNDNNSEEKNKEPSFESPIKGEIIREFAKDSLVYSETLKEWITHYGIDIKAERATVVKAAEDGTVMAIKNDPRYGLTVIIEHNNGYKSLYANLLTTEFVSEGEKVKKGQTIATIGDSAVYEIVDESHLHFEILKNNENVNPEEYLK